MPAPRQPELTQKEERQQALRRYHILDTAPERDFDRITSLIARVCDAPTALITLIDTERQWFKSCFGLDVRQTGLDVSFCLYAVHNEEMLIVEDATQDPRFKDNALVTGPPHIRFYAGAPLKTPDGVYIGSLCIIDYEPRVFDAAHRAILTDMADLVVNQFEVRSAEAQYRQLFDAAPRALMIYDPESLRIVAANEAATEQYGFSGEELRRKTVRDLYAEQSVPAALREGGTGHASLSGSMARHLRKDGSGFVVELQDRPIFYEGRSCRLLSANDITERLRTEQRLRDAQQQSQGLLEHLPEAVFELDAEGRIAAAAGAWKSLVGRSAKEVQGTFLHSFLRSEDHHVIDALRSGQSDESSQEEPRHRVVHLASGAKAGLAGGDGQSAERPVVLRTRTRPSGGTVGSLVAHPGALAGGPEDTDDREEQEEQNETATGAGLAGLWNAGP